MRYFIVLIIFVLNLYSQSITDKIIKTTLVLDSNKTFIDLKNYNSTVLNENDKLILKLILNKEYFKDKGYYLRIYCDIDDFTKVNTSYIIKNRSVFVKLDTTTPKELFLYFNKKNTIINFEIITQTIYENFIDIELLIFGIAYGIMICAFLYNLVFYFYNKIQSFLYYSLLQASLLVMLVTIAMPYKFFYTIFNYVNIYELSLNFAMIFSILFNKEFLNTKKYLPQITKFLHLFIYLTIFDMIYTLFYGDSILSQYIPSFVIVGVLLFSAFIIFAKGYKPALFYIFGWIVIFLVALISDIDAVDINAIYTMHLGLPLESLIFSLALGYKVKQIELDRQKKEQLLIHQSKLASMGEMINNIAHQWRQPLTHLSYANMNLKTAYEKDKLTAQYFDKKSQEITEQIEFMSHTIDDFRNFFKINREKEEFNIIDTCTNTINLFQSTIEHHNIKLITKYEKDIFIISYENELSQVIFNILNNAQQELIKKQIQNPTIKIEVKTKKDKVYIMISDNALGVDEKIKNKIFEPYFTTKDKGVGIGLYMSKIIIEEHLKGKLRVENIEDGALFEIVLDNGNQ